MTLGYSGGDRPGIAPGSLYVGASSRSRRSPTRQSIFREFIRPAKSCKEGRRKKVEKARRTIIGILGKIQYSLESVFEC
jgi:hypothetical protein